MPRERVGYFRIIVRRNGEWSLGPVKKSAKVKEAFDPVIYLDNDGLGFPKVVVRLPFSSVTDIMRRMGEDKEMIRHFEVAVNALLHVLHEIEETYGENGGGRHA